MIQAQKHKVLVAIITSFRMFNNMVDNYRLQIAEAPADAAFPVTLLNKLQ